MNTKILKKNSRSQTVECDNTIEKTFFKTEYFDNCHLANQLFKDFPWYTPWIKSGQKENSGMWFTTTKYNSDCRLDKIVEKLDIHERYKVALDIFDAILDMYIEGFSHRDIHAKNIFYVDGQIKIIDFEYIHPIGDMPFLESYDITGRHLPSPCHADNMCLTKKEPMAILECLDMNYDDILDGIYRRIMDKLFAVSGNFKSKNGYHKRNKGLTYGSFDLLAFGVTKDDAQRDTEKRLKKFGIDNKTISGKTILDIGSNIGAIGFSLEKYKPKKYLGIEYCKEQVDVANRIAAVEGLTNYGFSNGDFGTIEAIDFFYGEDGGPFDTVFCLSVNKHINNEDYLYRLLGELTGKTLFFEGNYGTNIDEVSEKLKEAGFRNIFFCGHCDDDIKASNNNRPLLVAEK